jgi:hypothetical protein
MDVKIPPDPATGVRSAWLRAKESSSADGLSALLTGASLIVLGIFFLPLRLTHSEWWWLLWMAAVFCFYFFNKPETLEWLKSRVTYPRAGYAVPDSAPLLARVKLPRPPSNAIRPNHIGELCFLLLWALAFVWEGDWLFAVACCVTAGIFWWQRRKSPPWLAVGALLAAACIASAFSLTRGPRLGMLILLGGSALFARGTAKLVRFLVDHPAPRA